MARVVLDCAAAYILMSYSIDISFLMVLRISLDLLVIDLLSEIATNLENVLMFLKIELSRFTKRGLN